MKIKTNKYVIKGEEISLHFNCNSKGLFSVTIPFPLAQTLGIDSGKTTGDNLQRIEDYVQDAFKKYLEANTNISLVIYIRFNASGYYARGYNGEYIPDFQHDGRFSSPNSWGDIDKVCLDYSVLMKKVTDGVAEYYATKKISDIGLYTAKPWEAEYNGYLQQQKTLYNAKEGDTILIPYSELVVENLDNIRNQLKKASMFLLGMLKSGDLTQLLNTPGMKLLTDKQ